MDLNLKGRVAVITGPAKGMGAAITMAFAAEGARLALIGRDTRRSSRWRRKRAPPAPKPSWCRAT